MITMVLGGLWHGAAWTFVIWGALQGVGQSFGHVRRKQPGAARAPGRGRRPVRVWVQRFLTFQFVCLGWVFFNATGTVAGLFGHRSPLSYERRHGEHEAKIRRRR